MEASNEWAPPTIGDIRLPDRDLGRRLSRQPDVEIRAKLLGLDWTTLKASRTRLLVGAWIISSVLALTAILGDLGQVSFGVTVVVVLVCAAASMLALRESSRLPVLIARNDPSTAGRYGVLARMSPRQSLLGYRVRWILLRHTLCAACSIALVALMARGF